MTLSTGQGTQNYPQTAACVAWLECLGSGIPPGHQQQYGPEGTCWYGDARLVEQCDAVCVDGYNAGCAANPTGGATTGSGPGACAFEELAPTATSWLVAGDQAGMLPTEVGDILTTYCSCHLADLESFDKTTPLYYGELRLHSYADMHANWQGAPTYNEVRSRTIASLSMPPLYYCGDGDFGSLAERDYEVLRAWLDAEAPDAPTWLDVRPDDLP